MQVPDFITHYYYPDKLPFQNLIDLPEKEFAPVVMELNSRYERGETKRAFPNWYFPQRREAELKLRQLHNEKGIITERESPHYFVLGRSPALEWIYNNNFKTIELPVKEIASGLLFSIGDTLWTMAKSQDPSQTWENKWYQGKLYSYQETIEIIRELNIDIHDFESLRKTRIAFIETFIWSDQELNRLLKK